MHFCVMPSTMSLLGLSCLVILTTVHAQHLKVEYYTTLIKQSIAEAEVYQLPENANEFKPKVGGTKMYGTFDYIIVGAGSAGAVIANRLSEDENLKILLVEAGGEQTDFSDIPNMIMYLQGLRFNWNFISVPQNTCCLGMINAQCAFPRGKGLGGTSIINALMYVRGNKNDFDTWKRNGNSGWSYREVLKYFKKSENSQVGGEEGYHGYGGMLNVEYIRPYSPQFHAFIEANVQLGRKIVDYNGKEQLGVAKTQLNVIGGKRDSTGRAFLARARDRHNLHILQNSYVTKVLISTKKEAYGIVLSHNGMTYTALANKEVIVSAGAISSPHLLMLSGIGPANELRKHGIPVIQNLPVGKNLQDHATFYGLFFTSDYTAPNTSTQENVIGYLSNYGPYTMPGNSQGVGFYQTKLMNTPGVPDVEIIIIPTVALNDFIQKSYRYTNETYNTVWKKLDPQKTFTFYPMVLHPESRGTVSLNSSDPYDYPKIDPRFLSDVDNIDIETMYQGIQLVLEMINTNAFKELNAKLVDATLPSCKQYKYLSREYWYCQIRQLTADIYHPMGTCKMGPRVKKDSVVDDKLRVHGIKRLRVADTSIIPEATSGHPSAVAIMIGEKLADMLKTGL